TVRVEVYRAPDGVDAPNVYFLDGVGSESPSGWSTGMGWGDPALRDRAVNVIAPTGAPASMWSDWQADDPVLGPNMWETFLIDELPPLLEQGLSGSAAPLAHNGSWGVMGLSMGASAAVHLANTNPGMFDAVAGISGAYSTMDELGYQYARLTVAARNGDATNMWGPRGSQAWRDHDTVADPSGLAGKTVYLSAATGRVGSAELGHFGSNEMILVDGHVLEKGSYESTRKLESALAGVAGVDLRMNYMPTGIHNWPVFVTQMLPGMDHILSGLAPAAPSLRPASGGVDPGSAGSAGSLGSTGSASSLGG
ncbi:MAG: alpha/beta hydrolase family protein, partial [Dietzia cercidiphylli]